VYNVAEQTVGIGKAITFDSTGAILGVAHENRTELIEILSPGFYLLTFTVSGTEPNQFAMYVGDKLLKASVFGSGAGTQQTNGQVIVELKERDQIRLVNVGGDKAVGLAINVGGKETSVNAAVTVLKLNT
jgi:hypothetical protein